MKSEFRYGALEFRETDDGLGVVVTGPLIRYGDSGARSARISLEEEFKPGLVSLGHYANPSTSEGQPDAPTCTQVLGRGGAVAYA